MLSFEVKKPKDDEAPVELEVFLDREGLESLLAQLRFLETGKTDHVHLMPESWGGWDLDELPQNQENIPMHHVKIMLR